MKKTKKSSRSAGVDLFDTYLTRMQGRTAIENVIKRVQKGPRTIGELAHELNFSPEDLASAIGNAANLGIVRLEKKGEETVVISAAKKLA